MAQVAPTPDPKARNRKRVRLLVWIVAVLIVLGLGAGGTVWWVLGQYYVGATEDNHVAIFEGVRGGPVLGIPLHRVAESSCLDPQEAGCNSLTLDMLQESAREDVRKGVIPEKPGVDGAREAVRRLWLGALLPACTADTATTGTSTTTTTTSAAGTSASGAPGGAGPTSTTTTAPTLTSAPQQPGKNCRKVG
jgi:protein phosphatase